MGFKKLLLGLLLAASPAFAAGNSVQNFKAAPSFSYSTASRACYLDASKQLQASTVTQTELGFLSGVTSAIQTQLNATVPESRGGTNQTTYAKGDILQATATNTLGKLPAGTQGQIPVQQSTGLLGYENFYNISTRVSLVEDFLSGYVATNQFGGNNQIAGSVSGTGAAVGWDTGQTSANPGVVAMDTGTTTTGWAFLVGTTSGVNNIFLGGGTTVYETIVKLSALSDGTNTYTAAVGLCTGDVGTTQTNGIYFQYGSAINSGQWTGNASKASSATVLNGSIAATTNFTRLTFVINSAYNSVEFFVGGVSIGTIPSSTNFPTAGVRLCWKIEKSAGTTSRRLSVDAYSLQMILNTPR